jgi:hypothetical protein
MCESFSTSSEQMFPVRVIPIDDFVQVGNTPFAFTQQVGPFSGLDKTLFQIRKPGVFRQ